MPAQHHRWATVGRGERRDVIRLQSMRRLAELLTFLADWLSGSQKHVLKESLAAFVGHPAYNTSELCADLYRFTFLLGATDGEQLFGEPAP